MQPHNSNATPPDERLQALSEWACSQLEETVELVSASSDASFRRYFRVTTAKSTTFILMDAPPERENSAAFVKVAGFLQQAGVAVPEIHAVDLNKGFMLLEDLGSETWLAALTDENAAAWFSKAIDALLLVQQAETDRLPLYDRALLQFELDLFTDWYLARHLECELPAALAADYQAVCGLLIESALAQGQVFVHRDYMPRNLMVGTPNPRIIDFQDAVLGPVTYDLASLFKDAFRSWPEPLVQAGVQEYLTKARALGFPLPDDDAEFQRQLDWMGVQRHLKVIGIFARIYHRDGKDHYIGDVPRFFAYLHDIVRRYPELAPLQRVLDWVQTQ